MANLALHFDTSPGTDASALADQLQSGLAMLPGVESSNSKALGSRDPLAAASAVMAFLTVAHNSMKNSAKG